MELKKASTWEIEPSKFDLNRVLSNLRILEEGPVTLQEYLQKKTK